MSTEPEKVAPTGSVETEKAGPSYKPKEYYKVTEAILRLLLLASLVVAVVVMVTSKETELISVKLDPFPPFMLPLTAKFTQSPAFIYFVAGLSVAGLYTIISTLASFYNLLIKPGFCPALVSHFIILDVVMLGIVGTATGAAGGVAYIGLKGNSHVGWTKVCNKYGKLCTHLGASLAVSFFAFIVLLLLIILSIHSLSKKIPK
ncbi:PREDICTED: CASP-like protein IN26 [Ipomoea nil]